MAVLKPEINQTIDCENPHSVIRKVVFAYKDTELNPFIPPKIICQITAENNSLWSAVEFDSYLTESDMIPSLKKELFNQCVSKLAEHYRSYDLIKRLAQVNF